MDLLVIVGASLFITFILSLTITIIVIRSKNNTAKDETIAFLTLKNNSLDKEVHYLYDKLRHTETELLNAQMENKILKDLRRE